MSLFRSCFKNSEDIPGSSKKSHGLGICRSTTLDWERKHKNAIRTASYKFFEEKARNLRYQHNDEIQELPSSSNCQLKPFMLIVDQLLEPSQEAVNQKLNENEQKWKKMEIYELMHLFSDHSLKACRLSGRLIDFIEKAAHDINCLENVLLNVEPSQELQVVERLYKITNMENLSPDLILKEIKDVCNSYNTLHQRLENNEAAGKKKIRNLTKYKAQLDTATKESYCIHVSLQTIDYYVKLLHEDFLTIKHRVEFLRERPEIFFPVIEEVTEISKKVLKDMKVIEVKASHLFHTINRAMELVIMAKSQV